MDVAGAASFFDETLCVDAFTPGTTFLAQLDLFDESRRDGITVARRILSVAPSVTIPARRVITINGEPWIVGAHHHDFHNGDIVRTKYVIHRADGGATIKSPAAIGGSGVGTYASRLWVKDLKEVEISSDLAAFYNVYLPTPETVAVGDIITILGELYSTRNVYFSAAGFLVAEADKLEGGAVVSAVYTTIVYNRATDTHTAGVATPITMIVVRWQSAFSNEAQAAEKFQPGDIVGLVAKTTLPSPVTGARVVFGGLTYEVISVESRDVSWGLHLRPARA